jgi:CRISPR-associated protein Cmr6
MRNDLAHFKTSHAGLLLERLVPDLSDTTQKPEKIATLIKTVEDWDGGDLYRDAFRLFRARLQKLPNIVLKELSVTDRIIVGLGVENPMETSITLNRLYGVPVIPGSALKGVARRYAEMFEPEEKERKGDHAKQIQFLFGDRDCGGRITFFDAWWVPSEPPLCKDVITVHHQQYYTTKGKKPPTDFDDPNPVSFVSAKGAFLFAVQGPTQEWSQLAMALLQGGLCHLGVGAKTSSGYGRFRDDTDDTADSEVLSGSAVEPEEEQLPPTQPTSTFANKVRSVAKADFKSRSGALFQEWEKLPDSAEKKEGAKALLDRVAEHPGFDKKDGQTKPWVQKLRDYVGQG